MLIRILKTIKNSLITKKYSELRFWQHEIQQYQKWFNGELPQLYKTRSPLSINIVLTENIKDSSILTWHKLHQEPKYLNDLELSPNAFEGMTLLDIGSGPMPSATCFKGSRLYCLDPLLPQYLESGFPLHYYENVHFIHGSSEHIPIKNNFFDAVISVNAIDHVDNLMDTSKEIKRVLKMDGLFRMHVHYHPPTKCEPNSIDDNLFLNLFNWCNNLKKIKVSQNSFSIELPIGESFVLWSNF